jgi:hypothetical protein
VDGIELAVASDVAPETAVPEWWNGRRAPQRTPTPTPERITVPPASQTDCFHTGAHLMQLPTFYGRATARSVRGVCAHCGLVKRYPTSLGRAPERAQARRPPTVAPRLRPDLLRAVAPSVAARTTNIAFDAACHLRTGPAVHLEQLAVQVDPSALFVDAVIRAAESLGHIEVERHHRTFSIGQWEVMPPSLVELPSGFVILTGRRSGSLVEVFTTLVEDLGGEVEVTRQPAAPDRIRVKGLSPEDVQLIADDLGARFGLAVSVIRSAAHRLAASMAPLSDVLASLPRQALPSHRSAKRWDPTIARWQPATDASTPGFYQLASATTTYAIRDAADIAGGTMRRGDARLVKHVAAMLTGHRLVGYDEPSLSLYMPLGAELPLLYGRAAVLASGLLPEADPGQGMVVYRSVPPDLAARLMSLVSS